MYRFQMGLLRILFGGGDDEEPQPWKEDRVRRQEQRTKHADVMYDTDDYDGPGWWVHHNGGQSKHETKQKAMSVARKLVGEDGEVELRKVFWSIDPPTSYRDHWGIFEDPTAEPESKEEAIAIALEQAEEKDEIHIRYEDKENQKLSLEEARELVR